MSTLVLLVAKVTLVLVTGMAAARLLRRGSASLRGAVIRASILAAALMPLLGPIAPTWVPDLPRRPASEPRIDTATEVAEPAAAATSSLLAEDAATRAVPWPWPAMLIGVLLGASAVALGRLALRLVRLRALRTACPQLDDPRVAAHADEVACRYGIERKVTLLRGADSNAVFTWGLRTPHLVLPASVTTWSDARVRAVLLHELAHVARRDWAWLIGLEAARALYCWHPLMWMAVRSARREAEHACDDLVLSEGESATSYADVLLSLARSSRADVPVAASSAVSFLEARITAMLDTTIDHGPSRVLSRALCCVPILAASLAVAGAGAQPVAAIAGTVSGVVRPSGGSPIADVDVVFSGPGGEARVRTDAAGEFRADLPAGVHRAAIRLAGFKPFEARVDVEAGGETRRDFALALGSLRESITVAGAARPNESPVVIGAERVAPRDYAATITVPIKIRDVRPEYPSVVQAGHASGEVVLSARVGADGLVTDVEVMSTPHDQLSAAAIAAVEQWRYEPTLVQGEPVSTEMTVRITFDPPAAP